MVPFFLRSSLRLSQSPWHDFFRDRYARHFEARSRLRRSTERFEHTRFIRYIWFISGVFALFKFLSCPYIVPLPKILASRLVTSLLSTALCGTRPQRTVLLGASLPIVAPSMQRSSNRVSKFKMANFCCLKEIV